MHILSHMLNIQFRLHHLVPRFLFDHTKTPTYFLIICCPLFHFDFPFSTPSDETSIATSMRAQIDRILALPSLLGVTRRLHTQPSPLLADIDNDNISLTHGDREGHNAVNDSLSVNPLMDTGAAPEATSPLPVNSIQIRKQIQGLQYTRHSPQPSDSSPSVINPDHCRDHRQRHQPTPIAIQSTATSTDRNLSSPDSNPLWQLDGWNREVSSFIPGLYA